MTCNSDILNAVAYFKNITRSVGGSLNSSTPSTDLQGEQQICAYSDELAKSVGCTPDTTTVTDNFSAMTHLGKNLGKIVKAVT